MSQKGEALILIDSSSLLFAVVYCQTEASNLEKKYLVKFEAHFIKTMLVFLVWLTGYVKSFTKWMLARILHDINHNNRINLP